MFYNTNLPPHLRVLKDEIEGYAREYGLDFYETIFEVVDADDLNEIAAYGGFPTRYPHWSFGMQYEELKKSYDYGLSKIYEMVINNDPCYAYLMRCNHTVDQKLVMAHVYGHCLAPDTLVLTVDGEKAIADIRVGDLVLTHSGKYQPVRVVARRHYRGDILSVRVEGEDAVQITGEHPVAVLHQDEYKWTPAGQLGAGMFVGVPECAAPAVMATDDWQHGRWDHDNFPRMEHGLAWRPILKPRTEPYDGYVYNLSVAEDESYTLSAGFVVHNCDFFKNNSYFAHTTRKMMDEIANHGSRIRRYAERFGEDEVEAFMDKCQSIDDLIDIHSVAIRRRDEGSRFDFSEQNGEEAGPNRFKSKEYMEDYINPPDVLKAEEEEARKKKNKIPELNFPERPEKDVLLFLIEHAPLRNWQRDVLSIVRDEAYYFYPQAQTKIMNEGWACVVGETLVPTDRGVLPMRQIVEERNAASVTDGDTSQQVYDWATFTDRRTIKVRTRRGLVLEGSSNHRVMLPDGTWRRLDRLSIGARIKVTGGQNVWAEEPYQIDWHPRRRPTLASIAETVGCDIETVIRHRQGVRGRHAVALEPLVAEYEAGLDKNPEVISSRRTIRVPAVVDESLAALLGYVVGDGHISKVKRTIGLTTGDEEQAAAFQALVNTLFGLSATKKWDDGRFRVSFSSQDAQDLLTDLGLTTGISARTKTVPNCILRSPKPVVAAFLRAYFDCDGYAGRQGVILSTTSEKLGEVVQILLLNFGILSRRRKQKDGCWHVHVAGKSAAVFADEIGFGLTRKRNALATYVADRRHFKQETWEDEVVSLKAGRADVYDVSVTDTHRYVAHGFVNHNSYWHSTIMTTKALAPSELIDYADHHSGTMATSGRRLNPYKLGIELLRDVEERWNTGRFGPEYDECDDLDKKRKWDKQLGLGRQKIFEVRRVHNDITFIDTFLTPEFCMRHKMFSFAYAEQTGNYVIESREFEQIKQRLLFSLTNFGKPWIYVLNGNFRNRGELLLKHEFNGIELKLNHARDVLVNIHSMWARPVHIETVVDGKPTLLSFDGSEHTQKAIGEPDESRRNAPAKTK